MMSKEQLEQYRKMTPGERIALSLEMLEEQWPAFLSGPPEVVERRFEIINRENDVRNQRILGAFERLEAIQ